MGILTEEGTGTTITFATSSFSADLTAISGLGGTREKIDVTDMTDSRRDYIASRLIDSTDFTMEIGFVGTLDPETLLKAVSETMTIDWGGLSTGNKWAFTGFIVAFEVNAPLGDKMTGSITIHRNSDYTIS